MRAKSWVTCPICGDEDMERVTDRDGNVLIECTNHACASNGGTNCDELRKTLLRDAADEGERPTTITLYPDGRWESR